MSRPSTKIRGTIALLGFFGIAMGAFEAIVVVYLRQIYYPRGFEFPLTMLSGQMLSVECLREAATMVMLATVGIVAGRNRLQRLSFFLCTFAVWDIFYYVWLKVLLDWPPSLLTWDVLFLIPVPWIGPVLAPVIASLTMILYGGTILFLEEKGHSVRIRISEWGLTLLGALLVLLSFVWDYSRLLVQALLSSEETPVKTARLYELITGYVPTDYNWFLFSLGEVVMVCAIVLMYRRTSIEREE